MITIGLVGDTGRAGTIRTCIKRMSSQAVMKGYFNYGNPDETLNEMYHYYATYEEMLNDPEIDAIILSNYFCSHAKMAIQALRAGKHVLSEVAAAVTPKECVELVEAVEESGKVYSMLESHALLPVCIEMKHEIETGNLGQIAYAEGEYCHPMTPSSAKNHQHFSDEHWRSFRPCTFYVEHALGPLMYMLDVMPTSVVAKGGKGSQAFADEHNYKYTELCGMMLVDTDRGTLLRTSGCTHYAGRGRYYRVNGEYGGVEVIRGHGYDLRKFYTHGHIPDGMDNNNEFVGVSYPESVWATADLLGLPHEGADVLIFANFIAAINGTEQPVFDVYKSVAMAAVSIYGWRSILEGSVNKKIPDFRNKAERDLVRDDDLTPFWIDGVPPTLPCTK